MPRQGWETNKAGGKGPSAAGESDKSPPQPSCPVHPRGQTGPPAPHRAPPSAQDHLLPWPLRPLLRHCPRQPAPAARCGRAVPDTPGAGRGRAGHRRAPALPSPDPPCAPGWGLGSPGEPGRAPRARAGLGAGCSGGVRGRAQAEQPGKQMDSSSTSIPHPFSPRQTPSDFHKSKRHTV